MWSILFTACCWDQRIVHISTQWQSHRALLQSNLCYQQHKAFCKSASGDGRFIWKTETRWTTPGHRFTSSSRSHFTLEEGASCHLPCFRLRFSMRKRRRRKWEEVFFLKKGVFASRVVPNGVDATTAEWEGGATRFIHAVHWIWGGGGYYHYLSLVFKSIY